jgi:hypothetical protein
VKLCAELLVIISFLGDKQEKSQKDIIKGIVSRGWKGLQTVSFDRFEV